MRFFGLAPAGSVQFFKKDTLLDSFERNNFTVEYQWQPFDTKACFVVAKKGLIADGSAIWKGRMLSFHETGLSKQKKAVQMDRFFQTLFRPA